MLIHNRDSVSVRSQNTGLAKAVWPLTLLTLGMAPPTCGDTEVCFMGRHVVDAMVFPWQDHVPVLQKGDPAWQP